MANKQTRTAEEITTTNTRFVVGGKKPTYINGKSKIAVPTLTEPQAIATLNYYEQMVMGETNIYELVPVEIDETGNVTRLQ